MSVFIGLGRDLWEPFAGVQRHYAPSGASRLRHW
jgi:hypothetical protein